MPTNNTEQEVLRELDMKPWPPGWEAGAGSADRLRSSLDAAVYKHAVLGLNCLKYGNDSCQMRQQEVEIPSA